MKQKTHKNSAGTILVVTATFAHTGSETALARLLNGANLSNFQVSILVCGEVGPLKDELPKHYSIHKIPFSRLFHKSKTGSMVARRLIMPAYSWFLLLLKRPCIVYLNTIFVGIGNNQFWSRKFKTILHTHELEHMLAGLNPEQTSTLIIKPDFVIAASERAGQVFRTLGRTENMTVIPSPIDFEALQKTKLMPEKKRRARGPFIWLMAGSLDSNKNPVRFVEIARKYLSKRKNDHLVWLGGSKTGYSVYAQALAKEYGLADRISWVQPKDHEDYLSRFGAAHGVLITSDVESLSLVAIEALAMGKPVVSFDNGGTSEILGSKYGVLVPRYDIDLCVAKMTQIAGGRLKFRPQELKKRAQEFDVSRVKDRWLEILNSVVRY